MPDAIAKFIADNVYSINVENIEKELKQMFNYIKEAMVNRISNLEWLEEETKNKGLEKLEKKKINIGINDILNLKEIYQKYQYLENKNIDNFTLDLNANTAETGIRLKNLVLNGSFDDDVVNIHFFLFFFFFYINSIKNIKIKNSKIKLFISDV